MYKRELDLPVKRSFFLFGPRQTGKSTLLRHLYAADQSYYYDLLITSEYLRFKATPSLFREEVISRPAGIRWVIIDEIQKIPMLLNEVHSLMAECPELVFIMTGSSARKLKSDEVNLLGGRALTYHLHPLTIRELLESTSLSTLLRFGALPPVVTAEPQMKVKILQSYVNTYLQEEIEREAQLKRMDSFIHFLRLAAYENGHTLNFSNIGREVGVSPKTVQSYFELLQHTLIGFFLYPYLKSQRKRLSKHPKFYFFDTGVVGALQQRLTVELMPKTPDYGEAFEHFVLLEIMRLNDYRNKEFRFSYFRTENGVEVDLVIETPGNTLIAIEIKSTDHVTNQHVRGLRSFHEEFPHAKLYCVATVPRPIRRGTVQIYPWRQMLDLLETL
ncbi:MAG: ATP-binding protein [Deltaproteobacteria bacterium]|nr:ATP-binding protein [Deltaproteobacteria bacterium]